MFRVDLGFECKEPDCGEGFLRCARGIRVYREKDTLIFEAGDVGVSTNDEDDPESA